jgi:hypothetical protein
MFRKSGCTKCKSKDLICESNWPEYLSILPIKCESCGNEMQHSPTSKYLCFAFTLFLCVGVTVGPIEFWFAACLVALILFAISVLFGSFKEYQRPSKRTIAGQGVLLNILISLMAGTTVYIDGLNLWSGILITWALGLWIYGISRYAKSPST